MTAAWLEGVGYCVMLASGTVIVTVENAARELARIARLAGEPLEVVIRKPNLERVFLESRVGGSARRTWTPSATGLWPGGLGGEE